MRCFPCKAQVRRLAHVPGCMLGYEQCEEEVAVGLVVQCTVGECPRPQTVRKFEELRREKAHPLVCGGVGQPDLPT